ncbi:MAG: ROK family transcriptional regulator [Gammaproteobacteria bacterium]
MQSRTIQSRGSNQVAVRQYNERLVLQTIRLNGPLPKAELARLIGLTPQTVTHIVRDLEADGLLSRGEPERGRVGQPSVPFDLNPDGAQSVGIHIGRRSTEIVLINQVGNILAKLNTVYDYPEPETILDFIASSYRSLIKRKSCHPDRLMGVGVCEPGNIAGWQQLLGAPNDILKSWQSIDLSTAILQAIGVTPLFCNDASAACGAELLFGQGRHYANHLYTYIGSFIGGGLVLDGNLVIGRGGNAGAIGSLPLGPKSKDQLIEHSSLLQLEEALVSSGLDRTTLWKDPNGWEEHRDLVSNWISQAAPGIAMAALSATALVELDALIIDGAFPDWVKVELATAIEEASHTLNWEGVERPILVKGTCGSHARALGGAALPLLSQFAADHQSLMKAPA